MSPESSNVIIDKIASQLMAEAENLRRAAIKKDVEEVEKIIRHKEQLFDQLIALVKKINPTKPPQ